MDKPSYKLVGAPCGQHGQYTFYKALRLTGEHDRIIAIGDFFFVRIWQDSELVSIGELQLLWTDRVSDQTLVSLRLYFLPENTPDGRNLHGEDEVLAINEKVVLRAEDLLSWVCTGAGWRWGLRAVWRGACAPPGELRPTVPLHHTKLDFSDVEREKNAIALDEGHPGVVVFSYPRYCRYRALLSRLEGIQGDWLRDSLVAALGGYAAPTKNTRILYCKDTFEYPELEGHEFVCNHLAPKLKGRPRGRRRRRARSRSHSPSSRSSDSDGATAKDVLPQENRVNTPRRLSLRNGAPEKQQQSEEDYESSKIDAVEGTTAEDKAFMEHLRRFYKDRNEPFKMAHSWKDLSLRSLYLGVTSRGGYEAVCRLKLWRALNADQPARIRRHYERFLLLFENHERKNGSKTFLKIPNGKIDLEPNTIDTIDVTDSPLRDIDKHTELPEKRLRTPSPNKRVENAELKPVKDILDNETGEIMCNKGELNITSKPAEELNREFLESLPKEEEKPLKISVKPVEKLIEPINVITDVKNNDVVKLFEDNSKLLSELAIKHSLKDSSKMITDIGDKQLAGGNIFLSELAQKLNLGNTDSTLLTDIARAQQEMRGSNALTSLSSLSDKYAVNGHAPNGAAATVDPKNSRPVGRSSLRAVRVKPTRPLATAPTPPGLPLRPHSASSSPAQFATQAPPAVTSAPPITNFGIHHPPPTSTSASHSDDEIVEVPYKPKTPEIIDLDEYPESPQAVKKKKLDILKERGLEVTAIPTNPGWPGAVAAPSLTPIASLINPPIMLNPAVQHQIMTQAQLFQMYNIIPPNYANGIQPPRIIQAPSIFGSSGPEKTVYGNPKDPFMPPPHIMHGTPVKPQRSIPTTQTPAQDILDLTCKTSPTPSQKPAVEIVRVPTVPSPTKVSSAPQNLSKNYTLIDGKAVVGSNLEITLVNPKAQTPVKNRPPQKRSSNGKFVSTKTPTPPKDYPKPYPSPSPSGVQKKTPIVVPNYQINSTRDDVSPTSSTGSRDSQTNIMQNAFKSPNSLAQIMEMQKNMPSITPFMDPMYMSALYSNLAGQVDQRHLAMYRELANQMRGYPGLLNLGAITNTPTTKN